MKAAIFNPYLDTLGGGERYTLTFAKVLSENLGYEVDIEWKDSDISKRIEERFGFKLGKDIKFVQDTKRGDGYDLCFWVSDGSIPNLRSRFNIIHFQVPFHGVNGDSLLNKMKLFRVNLIVCNSQFTKSVIDSEYHVNSDILYPPVGTKEFKPKRKENIILYVGRFSKLTQNKGQDILIEAFKKLSEDPLFKDWKLVLAGGTEIGTGDYLKHLKKMASGFNIEFVEKPKFPELVDLYGKSKIFWSAGGFGVDEKVNPEKTEHFGMTLVEAMASGLVPVVFNAGGHKEIISGGNFGLLWNNPEDLVEMTKDIVGNKKLFKMSKLSIAGAKLYDTSTFVKKITELIKK